MIRPRAAGEDTTEREDEGRTYYPAFQPFTEDECQQLAAGTVPQWLADACRSLVEWTLQTGQVDYVGMRLQQMRNEAAHASTSTRRVRPGGKLAKRKSKSAARRASTRPGRGSRRTGKKKK